MQVVSQTWKDLQTQTLVPESYLQIEYSVTDPDADIDASAADNGAESFSETTQIVSFAEKNNPIYITNELNQWLLNNSFSVLNTTGYDMGFVSKELSGADTTFAAHPVITISFSEVHSNTIPGITIQWSEAFSEWADSFIITAYNGNTAVSTKTITGNTEVRSFIEMPISGYNKITIEITKWCLPYHRARIEQITLGVVQVFDKNDILGFEHSQEANILSLELPKAQIVFSINNVDEKWNPDNPQGVYQYLLQRQQIRVKYGYTTDNGIEWIKCGTFWLSEWQTPQNGITAEFTARDLIVFMQNPFTVTAGTFTLKELATQAFEQSNLPTQTDGALRYVIDNALSAISITIPEDFTYTCAEVAQLCANAACCVMYQDRDGIMQIKPLANVLTDYEINQFVSYTNAEYDISQELKSVNVNDGQGIYEVSTTGEEQTIDNPLIQTNSVANAVANWVGDCLKGRKTLSGEYRADPRADVLDKITVANKYASLPVFLTSVHYTYNGAFHGNYEGRVSS